MAHLGGASIFLSASDGRIGQRESVADFARTLSQYVDAVVLRTFKHDTIEEFAAHARCRSSTACRICAIPARRSAIC